MPSAVSLQIHGGSWELSPLWSDQADPLPACKVAPCARQLLTVLVAVISTPKTVTETSGVFAAVARIATKLPTSTTATTAAAAAHHASLRRLCGACS